MKRKTDTQICDFRHNSQSISYNLKCYCYQFLKEVQICQNCPYYTTVIKKSLICRKWRWKMFNLFISEFLLMKIILVVFWIRIYLNCANFQFWISHEKFRFISWYNFMVRKHKKTFCQKWGFIYFKFQGGLHMFNMVCMVTHFCLRSNLQSNFPIDVIWCKIEFITFQWCS